MTSDDLPYRPGRTGSLPSVDADGATRSPVRGDTRQPCAASTSWPQPAAACAIASGPPSPAAVPATATETSDASWCRIPFTPRRSASRRASASRNRTGSGAAPDGKWRRMHSISHDESTGVVLAVMICQGWHPDHHHGPRPHIKHIRTAIPACREHTPRTQQNRYGQ